MEPATIRPTRPLTGLAGVALIGLTIPGSMEMM